MDLAQQLMGKSLITNIGGVLTGGIISETEAYAGVVDKASHAFGGRRTKRTEIMFRTGGISYVYLCYGIHYLFNVVTGPAETPHAVLIRGIIPTIGIEHILNRRKRGKLTKDITDGPGKLSAALGIDITLNGVSLNSEKVWIEENGIQVNPQDYNITKRIGVDYAGEDAKLPYRFVLNSDFRQKKTPQ